jgi:hypothetical protein
MIYANSNGASNRFNSVRELESVSNKLEEILKFLINLDHSNILKYFEYWFVGDEENANEAKLVVITEYSTAGSLKKVLDSYNPINAKLNRTGVKSSTFKRYLKRF